MTTEQLVKRWADLSDESLAEIGEVLRNIRTATELPTPLTRTMSHWFAQAPDEQDIPSTFRWAQVRGLDGDDRLARTILDGRISIDFDRDDFRIAVLRWLIAHPGPAPRLQGVIIDYVYDQKFVPSVPNPLSCQARQARQPLANPPHPKSGFRSPKDGQGR